ncbi:major capsid protein [Microvirus mar54]|uniref:Major capsid protein n=1 Tax=Microvirus mar54 TaxID=2851190 RepID=A0A8F5XT82_9VIRU|nr:major capsid protein [Microvirus mar54]
MGIFSKNNRPKSGVKRNAFDGSFQNNLTAKMGYLYPVFCKETIAGDTFRIKPAFGLRFMPTAFPIQTKMRAHLDFFYVRNRNLWKSWKNWFTQIGSHDEFPTLSNAQTYEQHKTGSLGDYLGLPTTLVGEKNPTISALPIIPQAGLSSPSAPSSLGFSIQTPSGNDFPTQVTLTNSQDSTYFFVYASTPFGANYPKSIIYDDLPSDNIDGVNYKRLPFSFPPQWLLKHLSDKPGGFPDNSPSNLYLSYRTSSVLFDSAKLVKLFPNQTQPIYKALFKRNGNVYINDGFIISSDESIEIGLYFFDTEPFRGLEVVSSVYDGQSYSTFKDFPSLYEYQTTNYQVSNATDVIPSSQTWPYKVSALPFRAYEQIYNAFYRDDRNNPYIQPNGEYDPNIFLPTTDGGVDDNIYTLHKRNWEQDFLTTALPSPQFGNAPLVGLSSSGAATFTLADGTQVTSQLTTAEDGDTMVGFSTTSSPQVNNTLINMASSGISINDFRGVNALQRYLETKYRVGLKYRDQIEAHYGVKIKEAILDMPEFIGSVSQYIDVNQINQTSASQTDNPLGSYAGQLSCVGGKEGGFQKYCDEPGFIIGILSVVPVPTYSQLLPKVFTKINEPLDYFNPAFNHLGFQPIKYREVCPLQAAVSGVPLEQTFGYQRAWYDYLNNTDEIHGQFRTLLNDFVLARAFNSVPSLNEEFLTCDPESMNDIFTVNTLDDGTGKEVPADTILGQLHFNVTMMRPISRFGIPRLE